MGLNNLKIPGLLVHELFKNQLINPLKNGETPISAAEDLKEVVIILSEPKAGPIGARSLEIIAKILTACKWNVEHTSFINLNGNAVSWAALTNGAPPRICIFFGTNAAAIDLPVIFPEFRIQKFDRTQFLQCPSPEKVEGDRLLKSKLWLCMKELFNC